MELETIPYTIAFRPGSSNQVPDYLSRAPDLTVDEEVNEESFLEDRVYPAEDGRTGDDEAGWIERIAEEQRKDFIVNDAKEQLNRSGKVRRGQLKHASDHLNLRGGMLNFDNRLVIPTTLRKEAIGRIHRSSHFGQTRTIELMKRNYFWARMARDVKQFCRNCLICQKVKAKSLPAQPMEQFKEEGWLPGDAVAMDVATLPWGDGLLRYFIIMVDLFSQYVELAPLEDQTAESVVREFKRSWIYRGHGVPEVLLTDQGPNVDGQKVREICGQLAIEKRHTTAYHPQADGMAERGIGTVKQTIRCLLLDMEMEQASWPMLLPEVSFLLNNVHNASTKLSPHMLTFGREPKAPNDVRPFAGSEGIEGPEAYLEELNRTKEILSELARSNRGRSSIASKAHYDLGKRDAGCKAGDTVLLRKEVRGPHFLQVRRTIHHIMQDWRKR